MQYNNLLVVSLGKALSAIPPLLCRRQAMKTAGPITVSWITAIMLRQQSSSIAHAHIRTKHMG